MSEHLHSDHQCGGHHSATPSVVQSLDEMDFERGLWSAALNGETDTLVNKLSNGYDANQPDSSGHYALHYAARGGHLEACKTLLNHGASVNVQTRSGGATALHRAAYKGHAEVTELLISRGGNVLLADNDGKTALHKAAEGNHEKVARCLLTKDRNLVQIKDNRGKLSQEYGLPLLIEIFNNHSS